MNEQSTLRGLLGSAARVLRRDAALTLALLAVAALPLVLLLASLLGVIRPWSRPGFGPLLLDAVAIAAAAALVVLGRRRWLHRFDENAVATDAEITTGMPDGAVRGALELAHAVPDGTSPALARHVEAQVTARLAATPAIAPQLHAHVRRRRGAAMTALASLSLVAIFVAFAAPEHSRAAWAPLVHPVRNLTPPPLPALSVQPGDVAVMRGTPLHVHVVAPQREVITLHWRMQGDVPREEVVTVSADSAVVTIASIDAVTEYWVAAPDGAVTEHYRATPSDPLLLAELSVDVIYPAHVDRPAEHFSGEVPPLEVPEGTQIIVGGRATRQLGSAELRAEETNSVLRFTAEADRFSGTFRPAASASYAWHLQDRSGAALAVQPSPLEITVIADGAPQIDITFPATDTTLDASLRQPIVADARDDYGLTRAALISWRVSGNGQRDPDIEQTLDLAGDDRAVIRALLEGADRNLVPGDTLKFYMRVTDNSPRRQSSVSRTIALRLPSAVEMRDESVDRADDLVKKSEELAKLAAQMQEETKGLERRASAANARRDADQQNNRNSGDPSRARMDFEEAAPARQMLERQEQMLQQLEQMRQNLDALERQMEQSGLRDAELQKRLEELRKLYDEMSTPEMRQQLEQMRKAIEQLDPEAVQKALEQMAKQQEAMKEQLERSVDVMKRAAAEQQMNNLAQEARELATQQQALAEALKQQPPTEQQTRTQEELAKRAEEFTKALAEMQQRLQEQGEEKAAEQTGQAKSGAQQAQQQMEQAAQDAARQDGQNASKRGDEASKQLEKTAQTLDQAREGMAQQWKDQLQQQMQQATSEALELAERQQQLLDRAKQAEQQQQNQQNGQQQAGQQQSGQQQTGQQQTGQQQTGQQQTGQQQNGQQQNGQQQQARPGQQQGQQQAQQQQGGQQQGQQQQGGQQQSGGQQSGGQQGGGGQGGGNAETQQMRAEQSAVQQSLQQLGRNLQENGDKAVNRDVGNALGRANLSMQQTMEAMQQGQTGAQQMQNSVNDLNRLALSLVNNSQQMQQQEGGTAAQQTMQQLADLAKQQGALNGQSNALSPMNLPQNAMAQQMNRLAQEQMDIARRLGNLQGGRESALGDIDALAREAEELSRQLQTGRLPPEVLARQQKLFHRLLDAGRSLEKDEVDDERSAERPDAAQRSNPAALDPRLFADPTKFSAPTAAELSALPPAYRRWILDYFERLNRPVQQVKSPGR